MWITDDQNRATGQYVELVAAKLGAGRAIHPETAIASAARLSGSLLLRSFGFDLESPESGSVLLSEEANEKGPSLVNLVAAFLERSGLSLNSHKFGGTPEHRGSQPNLNVQQSLSILQEDGLVIATRHGLSLEQAAQSAALAAAFVVKECAAAIGAETGFNVAAYGIIEGAKTVPPKLGYGSPGKTRKPWYKVW